MARPAASRNAPVVAGLKNGVFWRELMTALAVGCRAGAPRLVVHVVRGRASVQVVRIDANGVVAPVADVHTSGDRTDELAIGEPVGVLVALAVPELLVWLFLAESTVFPAFANRGDLGEESC
jgi:hypothetical protein